MANTVEVRTMEQGPRNLVLNIHIHGDGSGEESARKIIQAIDYDAQDFAIMRIQSALTGFSAELIWEGSPNRHAFNIDASELDKDFRHFGGIINDAIAKTGNILITTTGISSGDTGNIVLTLRKRTP